MMSHTFFHISLHLGYTIGLAVSCCPCFFFFFLKQFEFSDLILLICWLVWLQPCETYAVANTVLLWTLFCYCVTLLCEQTRVCDVWVTALHMAFTQRFPHTGPRVQYFTYRRCRRWILALILSAETCSDT